MYVTASLPRYLSSVRRYDDPTSRHRRVSVVQSTKRQLSLGGSLMKVACRHLQARCFALNCIYNGVICKFGQIVDLFPIHR